MKKLLFLLAAISIAMFPLIANGTSEQNGSDEKQITLSIAHYYPEDNPHHLGVVAAKEFLEKETNGRITVEIYSNGSFGEQMNSVQAVRQGTLDAFQHSFDASYYPAAGVIQGPYQFRSYDHWRAFLKSDVYNELKTGLEEAMGVKVISAFHFGFRNVVSTKKCETVDDFSKILMRVVNISPYETAATVLGPTGVALSINDVYMGLNTGVVQATENPLGQIRERSFHEPTKYLIMTEHMLAAGNWIFSKKRWDSLSDSDKTLVEKAFWMISEIIEKGYEKAGVDNIEFFKNESLEVIYPDKQQFIDRLPLVFKDYPTWEPYYKKIQAMQP